MSAGRASGKSASGFAPFFGGVKDEGNSQLVLCAAVPPASTYLRFSEVVLVIRLSTFGNLIGQGSRLKRDLRVEAFWKVVETISGFIR